MKSPPYRGVQCRRETIGAFLQLRIGQRPLGINECGFVAEAARDIGIDEIGDRVVRPALQELLKRWRHAARFDADMWAAGTIRMWFSLSRTITREPCSSPEQYRETMLIRRRWRPFQSLSRLLHKPPRVVPALPVFRWF